MKSYFYYSCILHGFMIVFLATMGTLLAKPQKSYYSIDLMSSMPSGGGGLSPSPTEAPVSNPVPVPAKAAPTPKAAPPKPAPARQAVVEQEDPGDETLRMLAKLKKKRLAQPKESYSSTSGAAPASNRQEESSGSPAPQGPGRGGPGGFGTGAGIEGGTGTPFPFPWYLKAVADRLDKQWKPQNYDAGTVCVVSFVIKRDGQIADPRVTKSSRDSLYDQVALRAVIYANPMPPLPNGYPEDTLDVHMTFKGNK